MYFQHPIISQTLVDGVLSDRPERGSGIHGQGHWLRVERNGLFLAEKEGADPIIVSLFALFHDSRRINDATDPEHGKRGAQLALALFADDLLPVSQDQLEVLVFACEGHTDTLYSGDITVGSCWDADRLDLTRIGLSPDSRYLNTATAKRLADAGNSDRELDGYLFSVSPNC
jgi:uncharacterized protein